MIKKHGENMRLCTKHSFVFHKEDECIHCLYPEPKLTLASEPVMTSPGLDCKVVPIAVARTTDPETSHLAAVKIPTKKLWERLLTIRNLVLVNPGQCIRWYVNTLAEQIPAPALDAPGCRDSVGVPRHDVGFYGVWATLFAQSEKHGLIIKVSDPLTPTEKLVQKSPYPGESTVHVYEACTAANMLRMEAERNAYLERLQAQKAAGSEAKVAEVAQQRRAKKVATPDKSGFYPLSNAEPSQRA